MITIILLCIILVLVAGVLYAHRKHQDALTELKGAFDSLRSEFNAWLTKKDTTP